MISVIIPVYNEPNGLKLTLNSFTAQEDVPEEYEIIVVDNGSKDHTFDVAKDYQNKYPSLVKAVKEDTLKGSYAARNKGISIAKGDLICFIDADMTVGPHYLKQVVEFFNTYQPDYAGCRVDVYSDKKTLAAKYNQLNGFRVDSDLKHNQYVPTCCLTVKHSVFDKVGLFDARLESGGDYEFGQRVFKAGLVQKYAEHIVVRHPARWKYSSLVNKSKRVARGIAQLYTYYPAVYKKNYFQYFEKKRHLPKNPLSIVRKSNSRNIPVSLFEILILSVYHIPISFISSSEAKKAYQEMHAEKASLQKS